MSSIKKAQIRLPPLKTLRVKDPNKTETNPCVSVMSSVLACWASAGYNAAGCTAVEQSLRACMDGPGAPKRPQNNINFHLSRMAKNLGGPRRFKGPRD